MQDIGKYLTIYQHKSGDDWRIAHDIWNSSNPPLGPVGRGASHPTDMQANFVGLGQWPDVAGYAKL